MALLGLDIGTSACKGLVLDEDGRVLDRARARYRQQTPQPGRVELDADRVWGATARVIGTLAPRAESAGDPIRALACSASCDEAVAVDAHDVPVGAVIMSMDSRGSDELAELLERVSPARVFATTGLPPHPMHPLVRLMWLRKHQPGAFERVRRMLSWEEWVQLRLGVPPRASSSLAARTLAFDVPAGSYSRAILDAARIDGSVFSPAVPGTAVVGTVPARGGDSVGLRPGTVVVAGGMDQVMATIGAGALDPGQVHVGTGSWEAVTAIEPPGPTIGRLPGGSGHDGAGRMLDSGFSFGPSVGIPGMTVMASSAGGSALAGWMLRLLGVGERGALDGLLAAIPDRPTGLLVLPHWEGSYSPWLDPAARGAIVGLDLGMGPATLLRGVLEGTAAELRENLDRLDSFGSPITELRATGGGATSPAWLQLKADVTGRSVVTVTNPEPGAFAAASAAGVGVGAFARIDEPVRARVRTAVSYQPRADRAGAYAARFAAHRALYEALRAVREQAPGR